MLSQFQASYQRLEHSLQRLTDSIAAYNPSVSAADELVAADDAVNEDLKTLSTHQSNHARILALRAQSDSLDATLRSTIALLASTRKDILAIPAAEAASAAATRNEVNVDELLRYAAFISTTTVPPTYRKAVPDVKPPKEEVDDEQPPAHIANGIATPPSAVQDPTIAPASAIVGMDSIPAPTQSWLDQARHQPWEPWPSVPLIQRGALGDIQQMIDAGKDPAAVLSPEEQAEAEKRKAEEDERERVEEAEREAVRRRYHEQGTGGRGRPVPFNADDL